MAETIALLSTEKRHDAVLALHEALLLFQSEHLLAHLRFPQLDKLIGGNNVLFLEEFFDREQAGLIDENRALVLLNGFHNRAHRFRGALDDLFQAADALEQVFIEREVFLFFVILDLILFECSDSGENEQLVLTAKTILAVVGVKGAAGLAKHLGFRLKHGTAASHSP